VMAEVHFRQNVMAATLNPEAHPYLKDVTGNRRMWPVLCRTIDLEAFKSERDQLLAEADYRYGQGEKWWLHEPQLIAACRRAGGCRSVARTSL
jgi:predicted P-loop ATPase